MRVTVAVTVFASPGVRVTLTGSTTTLAGDGCAGGGGGTGSGASTAPTSQALPIGRPIPRWSTSGQSSGDPVSIAGLPGFGRWVCVGPPLSCSGPRRGSVFFWSPAAAVPQLASLTMLLPSEVT